MEYSVSSSKNYGLMIDKKVQKWGDRREAKFHMNMRNY